MPFENCEKRRFRKHAIESRRVYLILVSVRKCPSKIAKSVDFGSMLSRVEGCTLFLLLWVNAFENCEKRGFHEHAIESRRVYLILFMLPFENCEKRRFHEHAIESRSVYLILVSVGKCPSNCEKLGFR